MSVYRIRELLDRFHELLCRGCDFAEVHINEESDPASLSLCGLVRENEMTPCQTISSCRCDEDSDSESDDDLCYELRFTYDEIATIASALANMPSIYEKAINDDSYDPREREAFRCMSQKVLDLKNKMEAAFKNER